MRKPQPAKVVRSLGKTIAEHCRKIPGGFDVEDIHDLRVAYKKLRSFLRLMQGDDRNVKMPDEIKVIYRSCGTVRDMQLIIERLREWKEIIPGFLKGIHHDLFQAKELLVIHIEDTSISKTIKELMDELPPTVTEEMLKRFIQRKVATIHVLLLALEHEEELHAIRKALKDLVYVKKILETELKYDYAFPEWQDDNKLEELTTMLGDLNDQYIALSFLNEERMQQAPLEEQTALQQLLAQWKLSKEQAQQTAMQEVRSLQGFFQV
ncbi:MAG: CHAD domain-containing protein [Pseudobacter sp.]|uniref:CHAD domain-containing protein n=1 Tax=Pseudobacter sp. TaxID=2045420 RepID=UPI003F822803